MRRANVVLMLLVGLCVGTGTTMIACVPGASADSSQCATENPNAQIDVNGTYRYGGDSIFLITGTITFEQQGNMVRVTDTTYDSSPNREVSSGFFPLQGNKLVADLTPKNGDTDYTAHVIFLFTEDGQRFCVAFNDTNGDAGDMGKFSGVRQ